MRRQGKAKVRHDARSGELIPPSKGARQSQESYRVFIRDALREALARESLAPDEKSEWPMQKAMRRKVGDKWAKAKDHLRALDDAQYSTIFGKNPRTDPRGNLESLVGLYFAICKSGAPYSEPGLKADFDAWKSRSDRDLRIELCIPPSLDALLLVMDRKVDSDENEVEVPRSRRSRRWRPAERGVVLEHQVTRERFTQILSMPRKRQRERSRFFYLSWNKALEAQRSLREQEIDDLVLVLDQWTMVTSPTFCLLQAGDAPYLNDSRTQLAEQVREGHIGGSEEERLRQLAAWIKDKRIITTHDTTAATAFAMLLERLKEKDLIDRLKKPISVSFMTTLIELIAAKAIPDQWVVVGGPSQYWTVRDHRLCHILHAANEVAQETDANDKDSHYLIATRSGFLHPLDPEGVMAARHFRVLGEDIRARFNDPNPITKAEYHEQIATRLQKTFTLVEGQAASMSDRGILDYVDHGMSLDIGKEGGFVPIEAFRLPESRSRQAAQPVKRRS